MKVTVYIVYALDNHISFLGFRLHLILYLFFPFSLLPSLTFSPPSSLPLSSPSLPSLPQLSLSPPQRPGRDDALTALSESGRGAATCNAEA